MTRIPGIIWRKPDTCSNRAQRLHDGYDDQLDARLCGEVEAHRRVSIAL